MTEQNKKNIVWGVFAAFMACPPLFVAAQTTKIPPLKDQVALAKKALVKDFLDPDSAKFRSVTGYGYVEGGKPELVTLCGEVNGKNSYGAYTGFKRFYIIGFSMSKIETDDAPLAAWAVSCKGETVFQEK